MNNVKKELCRFCLKVIRNENSDITGNITSDILDVLLIEMDFSIDGKSLMCCDCQDRIERCFNFKSVCISSENSIVKYVSGGSKLDLEAFYLKEQKSVHIPRGHKICRLCMRISGTTKCMNNTDELISLTNSILHKFIPEVSINAVENPVICEICLLGIQNYSEFVTSCLDVEKKINRYCEARGVAKRQVKLYNVLQFIINEALACDIKSAVPKETEKLNDSKSNIDINSKELNTIEFDIKMEDMMLKSEAVDDGSKSINCNIERGLINGGQARLPGAEQYNIHGDMICDRNRNDIDTEEKLKILPLSVMLKEENIDENQLEFFTKYNVKERNKEKNVEMSVTEQDIKNEEIEIKPDVDMRDNHDEVVREKTKKNSYCCQFCTFTTRNRKVFDRHLLIHKTPAEVIVYRCDDCSFITKFKFGLKLHTIRIHGYPSKLQEINCKLCTYKSTRLSSMKLHELTHLPPLERPRFKCSLCNFQCAYKYYFREHLRIHGVNSASTWYRCTCSFKTLSRWHFKKHMRLHKLQFTVELFHCPHCPYKTELKYMLKGHLLKHKDKSEIITCNCDKCPYKAKRKSTPTTHMKIHKSAHEAEFYKCETCSYVTIHRVHFNHHILQHKDKSEVQMYRCKECTFETKYKQSITRHTKLVHGDPSQIKMYKCEVCPFQCKAKYGLKKHLVSRHKSLEEVSIYKCLHCSYKTKFKHSLKCHVQTHMDESRRLLFKCEVCGCEFKTKASLRRHNNTCVHGHEIGVKRIREN